MPVSGSEHACVCALDLEGNQLMGFVAVHCLYLGTVWREERRKEVQRYNQL